MGERKVLNKYYPPDFDPSGLPRVRRSKNQRTVSRMMLPMSIRCNTCGNYIYKGTKFNSLKEVVMGETYFGIQIFRFYFPCTSCSAGITFKTDPKNSDYTLEYGAKRNSEPWRAEDEEAEKQSKKRKSEEFGDAMKSLENRMLDSKREMDILAALDELKSIKSRHATVDVNAMLLSFQRTPAEKENKIQEEEDEALIKSIFHRAKGSDDVFHDDGNLLKRRKVPEEAAINPKEFLTKVSFHDDSSCKGTSSVSASGTHQVKALFNRLFTISFVKKPGKSEKKKHEEITANNTRTALQSLCQNYESDDD